jgi:hypothetical protein
MKIGDHIAERSNSKRTGIILEIKTDNRVPDAAVILWSNGTISGKWCDDLIISSDENRGINDFKS